MIVPGAHRPPANDDCKHGEVESSPHVFFFESKLCWRCNLCKRFWSSNMDGTNLVYYGQAAKDGTIVRCD